MSFDQAPLYDLLIAGGGINGAGIARDACGRGLSVALCDKGDFSGATSWASSKLIHGGLRYLENREFGLVRESLKEREVMLRIAPHLTRPLRFVLPHDPAARRPAWLIRLGLWLYDTLGGRRSLPGSSGVALGDSAYGAPLKAGYRQGFVYSDVLVDDARLTLANLQDAAGRGAALLPRTCLVAAVREDGRWRATLETADGRRQTVFARAIVNACGPWAARVREDLVGQGRTELQLVRGSHIVVPRLYAGEHAYTLQNEDGRVCFLIPFHGSHTLIGTTEVKMRDPDVPPEASAEEIEYLCRAANRYLRRPIGPADVVWHFAGVRPLLDDGKESAAKMTREYRFLLDVEDGAPMLTVIGGKLTTYRRLAEKALATLAPHLPPMGPRWTATAALPERTIDAGEPRGRHFGAGLYERDVRYYIDREWAREAEDILWRRTKEGLNMTEQERSAFAHWLRETRAEPAR